HQVLGGAGGDHELSGAIDRGSAAAAGAGDAIDRRQDAADRQGRAGADADRDVTAGIGGHGGLAGGEGDALAVDGEARSVHGRRGQRVRVRCGDELGGGGDHDRRGQVIADRGAGHRVVGGECAEQVVGGGAGDGGRGDVGLGRVADRALQHLVGDRLGAGDEALQRGDAGVGGLQHLHAVADRIEQVADVGGAVVEALGGEEVGGVVEGRVDLVAGGEVILGGREQRSGRLQREEVLAH